jgi:predicted metal-dependent phosphotriesterase family hydrolase
MAIFPPLSVPHPVATVQGPIDYDRMGITDAHNHLWIDKVPGADYGAPVLNQFDLILEELKEYRRMGGISILDCQPQGCGRDGNQLLALSVKSQINIIACTGFHRKKYYSPDHWLWGVRAQKVSDFLCSEISQGLFETLESQVPVKAGFIKIALEATWADCPRNAMLGAAQAAVSSKTLLEIHTEKGSLAEKACIYFTNSGVLPTQIVLCHMDKRPDIGLHKELARLGILLEYDTFYRPKYNPNENLWPLITQMVDAGLAGSVALATDMAEAELYRFIGGGAGLASFPGEIQGQLHKKGFPESSIQQMLGGNITHRLAGLI